MRTRDRSFAAVITVIWPVLFGAGASAQAVPPAPGQPGEAVSSHLRPRFIPVKPLRSAVPPGRDPRHIEVKFLDGLEIELDPSGTPSGPGVAALQSPRAQDVLGRLRGAGGRWRRAVSLDRGTLDRMRSRAQAALRREIADFNDYFILEVPRGARAEDWMDALNALPEIELAAPLPLPAPPPMPPDFEPLQGYLDPAPGGTDAQFAWGIPGGAGEGVAICDLEYSWNLDHEDLPPVTVLLPEGSPGYEPIGDEYHGTAVLGEMVSLRNGWGTTGASYGARCFVAPVVIGDEYDLVSAILLAASRLEPGDVILIEQQTSGPLLRRDGSQFGYVPCEWELSVYNAVLLAVGNGIHVVEGAGNGEQNLDDSIYEAGNFGHAPFRPENDSGAILVGAGVPPTSPWRGPDRSRLSFSNYGSRVDLQGWGVDVATTGLGDLYSDEGTNLAYTRSFGGTSSAAPNVASAVASLEGIAEHRIGSTVSPAIMRTILAATGSPQQDGPYPAAQHIGPRPDLRAAYQRLDLPAVSAPESIHAYEGDSLRVVVRAADLDGDPIDLLTAAPLPAGAVFSTTTDNTSGLLEWAIGRGQAGTYPIAFTASNSQAATATMALTIGGFDRPPVITVPGGIWGFEGEPMTTEVWASDPNGDSILSFGAQDLPEGAAFIADSTRTRAILAWTPGYDQAGQYVVTLIATSTACGDPGAAPLVGSSPLVLFVYDHDRAPIVQAPRFLEGREADSLSFEVSAADPDGDTIEALMAFHLPAGARFEVNASNTSGIFSWVPGYDQSGTHVVEFDARNTMGGRISTTISVANTDRPPDVRAPEEIRGLEGVEVSFDAITSDPDGDRIEAFEASGLPHGSRFDVAPSQTQAHFSWTPRAGAAGRYVIILTASAAARSGSPSGLPLVGADSVLVIVEKGVLPARVYAQPGDPTVRLGAGRAPFCVQIEPLDGLFSATDIVTVAMVSPGTGSLGRILALDGSPRPAGDPDGNGVEELRACFAKEDLRLLFGGLPPGRQALEVTVEGELTGGSGFRGPVALEVLSEGRLKDARVTPNPASGAAVLSFRTSVPGPLRLRVFDARGRLVREALDRRLAPPGYHDVAISSGAGAGALPTGIYFYKLESPEGTASGRFVVLR